MGSSSYKLDSNINNLIKGTHSVTVTDFKNCIDTVKNIIITSPDTIKIAFTMSPTLCFGGSSGYAKAFASQGYGPYSFVWSTGGVNDTIMNAPLGTYTVTVTDFNNCKNISSVNVTQPPQLISFNKKQDSVKCFGESNGAAHVQIQGGIRPYSFSWSSSPVQTDSNATNLPSGDFVITTTDSNSCVRLDTISVKEPLDLNTTVTIDSVVSCFGYNDAIVTINATGGNGGNLYNIGNGNRLSNKFTGLDSGVYFVTTKDFKGCEVITKFTITEPEKITTDIGSINASCLENSNGKAFIYNISGGNGTYTYLWSNGQTTDTASNLLALKKHFVTIKDIKNCIGRDTIFVDTNYVLRFKTISDSALCNGSNTGSSQVIHINGLAPYAYAWSSIPSQTGQQATNLNAGFYKVTVTDNNNCTATQNAFIAQPTKLRINILDYQPYCSKDTNGSLKAIATGGTGPYTYLWNSSPPQNTDSAFGLAAGNYRVIVTDIKGCLDSMSIRLNEPPQLLFIDLVNRKNLSCNGSNDGALEVKGKGGFSPYTYQWDNPGLDTTAKISNLEPGKKYKVTIVDNKGCRDTASFSLEQPDSLVFDHFIFTHVTCPEAKDGSMKILVKGGTVSNANPYQFSLDSIFWQDNRLFSKLPGGKYKLYVKDANGCMNKTDFEIEEPEKFTFSLQPSDTIIPLGNSVVINTVINSNNPIPNSKFKYFWSPSTGLDCIECKAPTATPFQTQSYQLLLTYNENCTYTKDALVVVENKFITFIPNAFSPNKIGPTENEVFNVYGEGIIDVDMSIFNRWGEKVYESHGLNKGWDGAYKGVEAQDGVYTYSINVTYLGGGTRLFSGSITLMK
ncbi:MAG: gliding motility-associated C-terminal domain-containing protein [Bacteroidetes bacterium]|nr:gliding motility-associated C-terminal domain-containing protein [Bacteroidota bacterium]